MCEFPHLTLLQKNETIKMNLLKPSSYKKENYRSCILFSRFYKRL
ncbi:hypothetical protein LMANV2_90175 [Leptospira interrogans serovar Manilae]|uniref:Uncharacterized protein n=1 Tax=Leptospira interrogans serovar Manilae TaxID=214675 RepID=A0AAQ1P5K4_LEPIR|nr:hypothetical protein LMANV2_90175 [Leptospira interrogans serovar Manilae]